MNIKKYIKFLLKFLFLIFAGICFGSCEFFDQDIREYFKEYTENAAIVELYGLENYPVDNTGIKCIPSSKDCSFTFLIRNPQNYLLNFTYSFNELNGYFDSSSEASFDGKVLVRQSNDRSKGIITFPSNGLKRLDMNNVYNKNLSGTISIYEPSSGRQFESYPVTIHVNTAPPEVEKATFLTDKDISYDDAKYVVGLYVPCFAAPASNNNYVHYNDTRRLIINQNGIETTYYFNNKTLDTTSLFRTYTIGADGTETYADGVTDKFANTGTYIGLTNNGTTVSFDTTTPEARTDGVTYKPIYYLTGISVKEAGDSTINVAFTIQDDAGLSSSVLISNKAKKLKPPVFIKDEADPAKDKITFTADEYSGYCPYTITHNGLATDDSESGTVYINYLLKKNVDGSYETIANEKNYGSATINLVPGKYLLSSWASKDNFVTSDTKYVNDSNSVEITVHRSANYYVSASGDDTYGLGSRASPYATIKKALEAIEANNDITKPADDPAAVTAEIRLLSDITLAEKITYSTQKKVLITGADGYGRIINGNNGLIFASAPLSNFKSITFKNITFTGGKGSSGSIIGMNKTNIVFDNCTITGNTAAVGGTATIMSIVDSNATFKNCTFKNNTMARLNSGYNGALYYYINTQTACKLYFEGKNYFYDNFEDNYGKSMPSNVCLNNSSGNALINFLGSIAGSKIGVRKAGSSYKPEIDSPKNFTSGYSTYNSSINPGDIFVSDDGYNIGWNAAKTDAAFYVSSSNPVIATNDDIEIRSLTSVISKPAECGVSGRTVKFNTYNKSTGEDVTSKTTWKFTPKVMNTALPSSYYSVSGNSVIFASTIGYGVLTVQVEAVVDGTKYSTSHDIEVVDLPVMRQYVSYPAAGTTVAISSAEDVNKLNELLRSSTIAVATHVSSPITIVLTNDITLTDFDYIGKNQFTTYGYNFCGTFDGNGHTVTITSSPEFQGLFYTVMKDSVIKNVTVAGNVTNATSSSIGGVLEEVYGYTGNTTNYQNVTVKNCTNKMNITMSASIPASTNYYAAGIVGEALQKFNIENCRNEGNITSTGHAAGIIGSYINVTGSVINKCINTGTIKSSGTTQYTSASGIVTYKFSSSSTPKVINCINRGEISGYNAGGISLGLAKIYNCINYGNVTGTYYAGGIAAYPIDPECKNNVNTGVITTTGGSCNPGQIIGDRGASSTSASNYYLNNEGADLRGLGSSSTKYVNTYCDFTCNNSTCTTTQSLTVNSVTSTDVVKLLNAWIDSQATPSDYSRWTYGADGLPKMVWEE